MDFNNMTTAKDLNHYFIKSSLWPAIAYTTILMLIGTFGNLLVLIVYRRHFRRSVTRMFIFALAALDLGNCLVTMPAELVVLIEFTTFPSAGWCKASRYLTYTFNSTSSIILISIALDRYFKVCRPTKTYVTIRRAQAICLGGLLFAAVTSTPALVLYGDMILPVVINSTGVHIMSRDYSNIAINQSTFSSSPTYNLQSVNSQVMQSSMPQATEFLVVNANFCLLNSHYIESSLPLLFYIFMFFMYLILVVLVIFFYSKVGRAVFILKAKHLELLDQYGPSRNSLRRSMEGNQSSSPGGHKDLSSNIVINQLSHGDLGRPQSYSGHAQNKTVGKEIEANVKDMASGVDLSNSKEEISCVSKAAQLNETGYGTDEASSLRDASRLHKSLDNIAMGGSLNSNLRVNSKTDLKENKKSGKNINRVKRREQCHGNPKQQMPQYRDEETLSPRNSIIKDKKRQSYSKIPKIKVQCESFRTIEDLRDRHISSCCHQLYDQNLTPVPSFYNSLLLRRIKSADNVRALSCLSKLQVPGQQNQKESFCAKHTSFKKSHRENIIGIGGMSKSCVSLDINAYEDEEFDPVNAGEKTLTLTKTSPKGKKKLCVLPLTGLATKTAVQSIELQDIKTASKGSEQLASGRNVAVNSEDKVDKRISWSQKQSVATDSTRPNDNTEATNAAVVTLRGKTCKNDITMRHSHPPKEIVQTRGYEDKVRSPRQDIVSTADILRESHQRNSLHPVRTSRMLFLISLVFVISFLPFFIIVLIRSSFGSSFLASLNDFNLAVVSVIIRSSLISNAVNPIIYGFLSTHFRRQCADIMCCIWND